MQRAYSDIEIFNGISDQRRAYFTGVTVSCGSRSTCMCSISRQNEARRSYGSMLSATHLYSTISVNMLTHLTWNHHPLWLTSWHPVWSDTMPVDINARWTKDWLSTHYSQDEYVRRSMWPSIQHSIVYHFADAMQNIQNISRRVS